MLDLLLSIPAPFTFPALCVALSLPVYLLCGAVHLCERISYARHMRRIRNTHSVARMLAASLPHVAAKPLR